MTRSTDFAFRAVHQDGKLEAGVLQAPSREAAVALISSRGVFVIELSADRGGLQGSSSNAEDLALGLRALANLLGCGIPLARALVVLDELVPPAWLAVLPDLRRRVSQGESLAASLGASSLSLPAHILGVIQAGEAGSGLAAAVEKSADLLEARAATQAALRNALAYPLMLAVAGSASVTLLVTVVLPRFATLLTEANQTLPVTTRLVLELGTFARFSFLPAIVAITAALVWWRKWISQPEHLTSWHRLLLTVPAIGPIRRANAAANGCAALAALLEAGVPLPAALPHAARASGDRAVEASVIAARQRIGRGERISSALEAEGAFTPTVARLVRIGEETGRLGGMLAHAARLEGSHALQRLQRLIRVLEPAMILAFGGVVMVVAAALLQAMYSLRPSH